MTGSAALAGLVTELRAAGCVYAEDEARLLLGESWSAGELAAAVARRTRGEPLEQVLGWALVAGVRVPVAPGVFVPRRRSALLGREAVARAGPGSLVLDLCCGAGTVGALVAAAVPSAAVYAADVDPAAVACARRVLPPDRVFTGDLYAALPDALRGRLDVIACNAPYVPTGELRLLPAEARLHEPIGALDGGPDGTGVQRRVAAGAAGWLAPQGFLLVETSTRQVPLTVAAFTAAGLLPSVVTDEDLDATVIVGRCGPLRCDA